MKEANVWRSSKVAEARQFDRLPRSPRTTLDFFFVPFANHRRVKCTCRLSIRERKGGGGESGGEVYDESLDDSWKVLSVVLSVLVMWRCWSTDSFVIGWNALTDGDKSETSRRFSLKAIAIPPTLIVLTFSRYCRLVIAALRFVIVSISTSTRRPTNLVCRRDW